jgi:hypothetical protein
MKTRLLILTLLVIHFYSYGQKNKTKNVVMISIDGYRWQEIFNGADSAIFINKKYHKQDSAAFSAKYWAKTKDERKKKLMPFFWNTIATQGQLYGNRQLGNEVYVRNKYWFLTLAAARHCVGITIHRSTVTNTRTTQMRMCLNL